MELNKLLPHDEQLEALVLGTLMSQRDALIQVKELFNERTFYKSFHNELYKAIVNIDERGESPDMVTVANELRKQDSTIDLVKISAIAQNHSFDIYQHALLLQEKAKRRSLIEIAHKLNYMAFDESEELNNAITCVENSLKDVNTVNESSYSTINDAVKSVIEQMNNNCSGCKTLSGTLTGFSRFDEKSGGLQKSDLIIIAADTSQGKTSLSVSMALNAALSGSSIAMYSMEMKKEQIAARMMSIQSSVPANEILYSKLIPEQFNQIDAGLSSIYNSKIYFDDRSTSNIDTIISSIRTLKKKHNIDGAIIDYLQILNVNMKGSSPEQQMGSVARRLKNLAKELDIWIIALSQLSRDNTNPVPSLNRLRDSGQIGEAADVVILIYRPEIYRKDYPEPFRNVNTKNTAMIDIAKGRNIGLLKFICGFNPKTTKFYELDELDYSSNNNEKDPF